MKEVKYSEHQSTDKGYYGILTLVATVIAIGLGAAYFMEHNGHYVTGMNNQIVWGMPHVFAIFLIVAASGALNVASIGTVFGKITYKPLGRLSTWVALALLVGGLAVLVLDLGRPDRLIIAMIKNNFSSIFAWNIYFYVGFMAIVGVYLWFQMESKMKPYSKVAGTVAFVWRLGLTTATGSIFGFLVAREAYDSAIMAPLFITMSFALGLAIFNITLMLANKADNRQLGDKIVTKLGRLTGIFIAALLYFSIVFQLTNLYAAEHDSVQEYFLVSGGIYTNLLWLGQIVIGSLLPLALALWPGSQITQTKLYVISLLVCIGSFSQLYIIIIGGQSWPLELFPGMEVSSSFADGEIGLYSPSLPEILLGTSGIAMSALLIIVGMKVLKLLPKSLANSAIDPHCK